MRKLLSKVMPPVNHVFRKCRFRDETFHVVPELAHNRLIEAAFLARGYDRDEARDATRLCAEAARHGIHTHNAIKALHLDDLFGSKCGGCVPGAAIEEIPTRFSASRVWNAHRKMGPSVAYRAIDVCIDLAEKYGTGMVSVDDAFHYFWGGGYVLEAAKRGYIGYTICTALLAEVVPFGGKAPALGTNPHSWAFPTTDAVGFPILVDWATSAIAMGRAQQLAREGKPLPPGVAVDAGGRVTCDPAEVAALLPFGGHKGYGLGLINEIFAGFIGGSCPTVRGHFSEGDGKRGTCFLFTVLHPDAITVGTFEHGRNRIENLAAILSDVLAGGNRTAILPGQLEAEAAKHSEAAGGFLFTEAEVNALDQIAEEIGLSDWIEKGRQADGPEKRVLAA